MSGISKSCVSLTSILDGHGVGSNPSDHCSNSFAGDIPGTPRRSMMTVAAAYLSRDSLGNPSAKLTTRGGLNSHYRNVAYRQLLQSATMARSRLKRIRGPRRPETLQIAYSEKKYPDVAHSPLWLKGSYLPGDLESEVTATTQERSRTILQDPVGESTEA